MRIPITYGRQQLDLEVAEPNLVRGRREPVSPPLADPVAAVRDALESPRRFPALRQALTPDDHVVVAVDPRLPRVLELLQPVLEHVASAGILPEAITLLCPASASSPDWTERLPGLLRQVRVEVHDPADRRQLSYLATMKQGRRLYLNRTAVDADQLILFGTRGYDLLLGYSGAEGMLYPDLADAETQQDLLDQLSVAAPGQTDSPVREEAQEAAWLLGAPFLIQVIRGAGDEIAHVIAGLMDTSAEGEQLLDARWRETIEQPVQTVVASLSGDPAEHEFADLARAVSCAARVVEPGGRIIVLSEAAPTLGPGMQLLRQADDPSEGLALLRENMPADMATAFQWASAARQARIYLLSGLQAEVVEELFATPFDDASQVQRLLQEDEQYLFIQDAHRALAVTAQPQETPKRAHAPHS